MLRILKGTVQWLPRNPQCVLSRTIKSDLNPHQSQSSLKINQSEVTSDSLEMLEPLNYPDFFQVHNMFTVEDLFNARVHYGHTKGTLNEHMKQFILGSRLGTLIF
ncbi:28S ribosomal protein S2, mitochondrial [Caerostris darwini]|uniref:28S ribosomal protein S2, mitochondrial n=1 Tax=Caerostris darwini TaxID=1538125 RepID=A0AAV4X1D0_9ARAC|nr:28S ribosomal protein S2, mitochondrial [Caerostris darwini]